MSAHRFARVAHARPRRTVLLLLLAILTCMTGTTHAPTVDVVSAHEFALSAHLSEMQQDSPGLDAEAGPAAPQNADEASEPLAGDSGTCSVGTTSHDGCLTVTPDHQVEAPTPSRIGWLADAPGPPHPLLRSMVYHPPAPTPGSLSINRT